MADNFLAGTAFLTIDGKTYLLVGEFTYRPSSTTRETLLGMDGVHGYSAKFAAGQVKGKLRDQGSISVQTLGDAADVTVVVELSNGKVITARNAWRTGEPLEVDSDDATFMITWESGDVREG